MSDGSPDEHAASVDDGHDDIELVYGFELRWLGPDLAEVSIPIGGVITPEFVNGLGEALRRRSPKPVRLQVRASGMYSASRESFKAAVSPPLSDHLFAVAFNVASGPAAGLVNAFLRIRTPPYATRVFGEDQVEAARAWLRAVDTPTRQQRTTPEPPLALLALILTTLAMALGGVVAVLVMDLNLPPTASAVLGAAAVCLVTANLSVIALMRSRKATQARYDQLLRESEQRAQAETDAFQAVLEEAVAAILTIDGEGRIWRYNRAAERLFGYGLDEVLGKNIHMLMPEPDHSRHDGYMHRYHDTKERKIIGRARDVIVLRKDGTTCPVRLSVSESVGPDGHPLFTGVLFDLTEIRAVEREAKRRAERLLNANQDLESFSRALSHDLRTPLRGIQQLAGWIREDLAEDTPGEVLEHLDLLEQRTHRLEAMIAQLHAFTRVGADQTALSEPINVDELLDGIIDQLQPPAGFEIIRDIGEPQLEHLRAPIELILRNLIQNAIRHHHRPQGRVWVRAVAHADGCTLCVEDDGPGIPEKHRERVFQPLETLRPRDDGGGSGLGLSLVRRTVKQLHGYLILRESAHGGARFVIDLPVPSLDEAMSPA